MQNKQLIKTLADWVLPLNVKNLIKRKIGYVRLYQNDPNLKKIKEIVQKNSQFKNIHENQRCFILATGPSINKQNLEVLKDEICIAVSQFFLHPSIQIINPKYHVLAPFHSPFNFQDNQEIFEGFQKSYSDDMIYFFGYKPYEYSTFNFLQNNKNLAPQNSYFINYSFSEQINDDNYKNKKIWDLCQNPFAIRTVIYSAIQISLYMGFKEIYLIGCDHDYLQDIKRVTNHHFYEEEKGISDVEHLSSFSRERWFEEYYYRWQQYRLIDEYAKSQGCSIFNATEGGMLDVFPEKKLLKLSLVK